MTDVYDLYPSESLGGFLSGVLDFNAKSAEWRRDLGFSDALAFLCGIDRLFEKSHVSERRSNLVVPEYSLFSNSRRTKDDSPAVPAETIRKEQENMEKIKFEQESVQKQYEARIAELKRIAASPQMTTRVLWDATVAKYARTIERVQDLMAQDELREETSPRLDQQMRAFLAKCEKQEFHIALVGAIKAGKSSLINAVLDEELASTEVTPETASLTKFRGGQTDCVSISFYSEL